MQRLATVFGGSGFIGRYVVTNLARAGWLVRVAVRRPDEALFLKTAGAVGQVTPVAANVRDRASIARAVAGAEAVVNLVGILHEGGRQKFEAVQAEGAKTIAEEAARAGARHLVQISAIGADPNSDSAYARTKAAGEAGVRQAFPSATILRPSIVFGPEDGFFNRFANMARFSPVLPLIGGGETKFELVYVGDVAEAIARSVDGQVKGGTIYELGGPRIMSFRQCMEEMLETIGRRRILATVPWWLAYMQASVLGLLPKPILTSDQVTLLKTDNVVSAEAEADRRTLAGIGIQGRSTAAILPTYLWRYRPAGQFSQKTEA
jgi:uncharacterized protein YbjT (DUF2867 family)